MDSGVRLERGRRGEFERGQKVGRCKVVFFDRVTQVRPLEYLEIVWETRRY